MYKKNRKKPTKRHLKLFFEPAVRSAIRSGTFGGLIVVRAPLNTHQPSQLQQQFAQRVVQSFHAYAKVNARVSSRIPHTPGPKEQGVEVALTLGDLKKLKGLPRSDSYRIEEWKIGLGDPPAMQLS